jgi:hypothetical protein
MTHEPSPRRAFAIRWRGQRRLLAALLIGVLMIAATAVPALAAPPQPVDPRNPDFGPNVMVFDPSMPTSQIQAAVDAVAAQQVPNQFGSQRYALLFKPGTYGTTAAPLNFEVGYYTEVAGLGRSPGDVTVNGSIYVHNQCDANGCIALNNFWRSLSNVTINVANPNGCYTGEFWAVSQAAPMRRVHVIGNGQNITLMDYCTGPSFASGGFIADSKFEGQVINGSQQQWLTRDSTLTAWTNGVWNQVFSGVVNAPAECFGVPGCGPYTTLATSPVTREKPFLYIDASGKYRVFTPALRRNSSGTTWENGPTAGSSLPIDEFFIAKPSDSAQVINNALARGQNLILTPGIYNLNKSLDVKREDTVVLGLGLPTLVPQNGSAAMTVADVAGVKLAGFMIDAGPVNSPVLLEIGKRNAHKSDKDNPTSVQDVFFRIGGAALGKATTSMVVNSDYTLLDDIWAWRADHGNGVGWTQNTADTGVIVNGDNVTAYGLFVEHYQKYETIWNGNNGKVIFYQNEMPYDPPSQAAWMSAPNVKGYPALTVANGVKKFNGYGMGSYSFFNQGVDIYADNAFVVPTTLPAGSMHDLLTIFLDPSNGKGGILNVINGTGGSSTIANPDVPVTVVNYP